MLDYADAAGEQADAAADDPAVKQEAAATTMAVDDTAGNGEAAAAAGDAAPVEEEVMIAGILVLVCLRQFRRPSTQAVMAVQTAHAGMGC